MCLPAVGRAAGGYMYTIRFDQLYAELGASCPTGAGVAVDQVEATVTPGANDWRPDAAKSEFIGKLFTYEPTTGAPSVHATTVGSYYYGNTFSIAPGIVNVRAYNADEWLGSGFLRVGGSTPDVSRHGASGPYSRVANHSWAYTFTGASAWQNADALERLDWVIANDELITVVGTGNGASTPAPALLTSAFNAIAVGRLDGLHAYDTPAIDSVYTAGRTKPDLVSPINTVSYGTPVVSAAAALLVQAGHDNPALSNGSRTVKRGSTTLYSVYHAETTEVVKAALMAGADRAAIRDWRTADANQSNNGLDRRFGAGEVDVYNSYHILAAGEQDSAEDGRSSPITPFGFDYDPSFGGASLSNATASYDLPDVADTMMFTASLAWNVYQANYYNAPTLYNLDLRLLDVTTPASPIVIADSTSSNQNTENLRVILRAGHDYRMQVVRGAGQASFAWRYGLGWMTEANPQAIVNVADGNWHDAATWVHGLKPDADVDGVIEGSRILRITADTGSAQARDLYVGKASTGTLIQSGGTLTVGRALLLGTSTVTGSVQLQGGQLSAGAVGGRGTIAVTGGQLDVAGAIDLAGISTVNVGAGTAAADYVRVNTLAIGEGATVSTRSNAQASVVSTLTIAGATDAWLGRLDLDDGGLIVRSGASALDRLTNQVAQAARADDPWMGDGIGSAAAAADPMRGLAVILNNDGGKVIRSSLLGQAANLNDVLIAYTWNGDADLNYRLDADDYYQLDNGFLSGGELGGYRNGDFNYDGIVDGGDYLLIDQAILAAPAGGSPVAAGLVAVPEPTSLALLAATILLARRRRHN